MKKGLDTIWLIVLFAGVVTLFWNNEMVYSLATRISKTEVRPNAKEQVDLKGTIVTGDHPFFKHIFNPYCPCSRYNISVFKLWAKNDKNYTASQRHKQVLYKY